jgi:uncharacterized protein YbjT (DUF2867 family)
MYAITGITGQVGSAVAQSLLDRGLPVRAVIRDPARSRAWRDKGCEAVIARFDDPGALTTAFAGTQGVFVMIPANFAPDPGFTEARTILASLKRALAQARPARVVCLSSIGAQRTSKLGLITQLHLLEAELAGSAPALAFLRPGWFMENISWDIAPARQTGTITSFLQPLDKPVPMVATADIGRVAAKILAEKWTGRRVIEIEGPRRYSPLDLAASLSRVLQRLVTAELTPRSEWLSLFQGQGTADPTPRIEMLDGFNSDWICFEGGMAEYAKGETGLDTVVATLAATPR